MCGAAGNRICLVRHGTLFMKLLGAVLTEEEAYRSKGGYTLVKYHCSKCSRSITLPEQQGFNYCYLCGARIREVRSQTLSWNPLELERGWEHG